MKWLALLLMILIPATAVASRTYQEQEQQQSNEAVAAFVNDSAASAIAPSGNGPCWGSLAFQNTAFGISFGRARRDCTEQSLAILLRDFGEMEKGRQILLWQYERVSRRYKQQYVCKRPVDEHCTTGAAEDRQSSRR